MFGLDLAVLFALLQPIAVDETEWWVELGGWLVRVSVIVAAITLLWKTPFIRRPLAVCLHWLWNNPAVTMTVEGLRELIREEVLPVQTQLRDVSTELSRMRRENTVQYEAVSERLETVSRTVDEDKTRLLRVEDALVNRWRRGDR